MTQGDRRQSLIGKIGSYLQIVTKDPSSTAFVPLAEAYRQIGLLDDALEAAKLGTTMLPQFSPGFASLGRILGQMGRIDEAMSAFARSLSIDRQSQPALVGLARLHLVRGERDQARKILQQAAEFHPEDSKVKDMLTALDLPRPWDDISQSREVQSAVVDAATEPSDDNDPGDAIPTATLAEIYVKQGLIEKAINVYQEILTQKPDNEPARQRLEELTRQSQMGDVTATPEPSEKVAQDETPPIEQKQVQSPLAVLERWLSVINQGRQHVQ